MKKSIPARTIFAALLAVATICVAVSSCAPSYTKSTKSNYKKKACDCPKYNTKRFGQPRKHY